MRAAFAAGVVLLAGVVRSAEPPRATPVRIEAGAIRMDGRLDEGAWAAAPPLTAFTQRNPDEGQPATAGSEVRFLYDEDALYVGARLASAPHAAPLGRRDDVSQVEHLLVILDTYHDRRTASAFGVTASGVRLDRHHPTDDRDDFDDTFDPVWSARVAREGGAWTAELRVPWSQLRFNRAEAISFGLQVVRVRPEVDEEDVWVLIPKDDAGFASKFGDLGPFTAIAPTRRVEFLPYASAGRGFARTEPGNPFAGDRTDLEAGGDVKLGLGSNLTLDATVNPDFGQVEADPAEVNLTAFETFFTEKRPFFTERQDLLLGSGPFYFYSRRIGAAPRAPADGVFVDYPRRTRILGAARLTGRLGSGTSVAALFAATDDARARTADETGPTGSVRVAPAAQWGVLRVQQEIAEAGSAVGLSAAAVHRHLPSGDPLAARLVRDAVSGGIDGRLRLGGARYEVGWFAGGSLVAGEAPAVLAVQRSSARYFQRPDAREVRLDPTRTSLSGWTAYLDVTKKAGAHWLWTAYGQLDSPGLELNDTGRLSKADGKAAGGYLRWRENHPGRVFRSVVLTLRTDHEWNFDGDPQYRGIRATGNLTWLNRWLTLFSTGVDFPVQDERGTRGGPSMGVGELRTLLVNTRTNNARPVYGDLGFSLARTRDGGRVWDVGAGFTLRRPRIQLTLTPYYVHDRNPRQFTASRPGGRPETYGVRSVFATSDLTSTGLETRVGFTLKPDLNLDLYAQPFAASGGFSRFGELRAARSRSLRVYGEEPGTSIAPADGGFAVTDGEAGFALGDPTFRFRSFRSTLVLRWEWRPGSTLHRSASATGSRTWRGAGPPPPTSSDRSPPPARAPSW